MKQKRPFAIVAGLIVMIIAGTAYAWWPTEEPRKDILEYQVEDIVIWRNIRHFDTLSNYHVEGCAAKDVAAILSDLGYTVTPNAPYVKVPGSSLTGVVNEPEKCFLLEGEEPFQGLTISPQGKVRIRWNEKGSGREKHEPNVRKLVARLLY